MLKREISSVPAKHNHGDKRPCKLRCGANEGICVLNATADVTEIFTDGLLTCAQIILRNGTATFTCHIYGDAPNPLTFMHLACDLFVMKYGAVTECHLISGTDTRLANGLNDPLVTKLHIPVTRANGVDGYSINIHTGVTRVTPDWPTYLGDVAGWKTAPNLIDLRITDAVNLGTAYHGDYSDPCALCRSDD